MDIQEMLGDVTNTVSMEFTQFKVYKGEHTS